MGKGLEYIDNVLHLDSVDLGDLGARYGTPLFVYSADRITGNYAGYTRALDDIDHMVCYAVKANYNGRILNLLAEAGAGADVVSAGELFMALRAGIDPGMIVFAGVGKTPMEIKYALEQSICMINVESEQELYAVNGIAAGENKKAPVALRVNPDIDPGTHPKIATGLKSSKFGIPADRALELYLKAAEMDSLNIKGLHMHIGSQITSLEPFELAASSAIEFADRLSASGIELEYIDIGGGLGIEYTDTPSPSPGDVAGVIKKYFKGRKEKLIMEPGRSIVGNAGYLLTRIIYVKKGSEKNFVIVDAGFNDLIRPAMYDAYHKIIPVDKKGETMRADVVGPVCESGDYMATDRELEGIVKENILALCDAGAYGFSMSSNYNGRPRPAEILIEGGKPLMVRRREDYRDLVDTEK